MRLPRPPILLITDRHQARAPLEQVAEAAFLGGCRWLSLREKDLAPEQRLDLTRRLVALARGHDAIVTVHGDLMAARECDGLHMPGGGDLAAARRRLGPEALIGVSAHRPREAETAADAGADYVTLSPIHASLSKPGYGPGPGLAGLRDAARCASIPVVALGGVTPDNAAACLAAGAAGVAVMGAVMAAPDPRAVMARLVEPFS